MGVTFWTGEYNLTFPPFSSGKRIQEKREKRRKKKEEKEKGEKKGKKKEKGKGEKKSENRSKGKKNYIKRRKNIIILLY